ncbi:bifunctional hydroxymethylpyrimidine kinase/phosphomethylpyrimidine kinase [Immundisolibacter sp.]|uniref:bifunctional hydroxymethylpyrimidine kinase/phosphomethylpyrimidine kinase n=1 Tax=Immundisolibacter sp. TaxID=1934948 RepID=UPI003F86160C
MSAVIPNVLSIAGSDPSGGAGIQADLKTFSALGVYGMAVVSGLTAQNTRGVNAVEPVSPAFVAAQIDAVFADIRVDAVKLGMLGGADVAACVVDRVRHWRPRVLVVDPVMVAKGGAALLDPVALRCLREQLLPLASVLTPNLPEAAALLGAPLPVDLPAMREAARALHALGPAWVLLKGGHLPGNDCTDLLYDGRTFTELPARRVPTANTHGTGCTLASAIAAHMARGLAVPQAVAQAKAYLTAAIAAADMLDVGHGHGPVQHFHALWHAPQGGGTFE